MKEQEKSNSMTKFTTPKEGNWNMMNNITVDRAEYVISSVVTVFRTWVIVLEMRQTGDWEDIKIIKYVSVKMLGSLTLVV